MKTKLFFGIGLILFAPLLVLADLVSIPGGLNWDASTMEFRFEPPEGNDLPTFSCLGEGSNSFTKYLSDPELGFSDEITELNLDDCFQQAGDYAITITLVDVAGNESFEDYAFQIFPSTPDSSATTLTVPEECATIDGQTPFADDEEFCELELTVKDAFENPVHQIDGPDAGLKLWSVTGDFNDDANTGTVGFRNGLKLRDLEEVSDIPLDSSGENNLVNFNKGQKTFNITAIAPSIATYGYLSRLVPRTLSFSIEVPEIDEEGELTDNTAPIPIAEIPLVFKNLFSLNIEGENFSWEGENGAEGQLSVSLENVYGDPEITPNNEILTNRNPSIEYYDPVGDCLISCPEPQGEGECNLCDQILDPNHNVVEETIPAIASLEGWEGEGGGIVINDNANLAFTSNLSYEVSGETITYPAGGIALTAELNANFDPESAENLIGYGGDIGLEVIGADIEGGIRGAAEKMVIQAIDQEDYTFQVGNVDVKDLRETIRKNATRLIRGSSNTQAGGLEGGLEGEAWFNDSNVAVVVGDDVVMPSDVSLPDGKNTLIIQNGNLIIEGNLVYGDTNDSFGVILINDDTSSYPSTGNIFVRPNVKSIVGTYFADGGIVTTDSDISGANGDGNINQLLLTGTLFTKNTLGGSMLKDEDDGEFYTPWGTTEDQSEARKYDLHFVRRYIPEGGNCANLNQQGEEGECDSNTNAFVIRIDRKASELPPPGFESTGSFGR